jgi:hypothetical protein
VRDDLGGLPGLGRDQARGGSRATWTTVRELSITLLTACSLNS